ncbi:hypothetical protein Tco_1103561 [Tanacetum coccineum]
MDMRLASSRLGFRFKHEIRCTQHCCCEFVLTLGSSRLERSCYETIRLETLEVVQTILAFLRVLAIWRLYATVVAQETPKSRRTQSCLVCGHGQVVGKPVK